MDERAEALLLHWLGPADARDAPAAEVRARWFTKSEQYDEWLAQQFGAELAAASRGERDHWAHEPLGRVALVILLDQLTRNLRRGTARMFDNDSRALALSKEALERGEDRDMRGAERYFLYMPFMHSEALEDQDRAVALFTQLAADAPTLDGREWAVRHRDIIARFGRFPHRNTQLDRTSTGGELLFLRTPGSSF